MIQINEEYHSALNDLHQAESDFNNAESRYIDKAIAQIRIAEANLGDALRRAKGGDTRK